jgi:transcriptional regulator with XRE-family HTH domain
MKCETCGVEMVERKATSETPYAYMLSGLPVALSGIRLCRCGVCGEEMPIIPRIEELHDLISEMVVKKATPLTGNEVRFLRKHAGYPAKEFAALLRIDASHLSRVENGHTQSLGPQADVLARAVVIATTNVGEAARKVFLEVAKRITKKVQKAKANAQQPLFSLEKQGWKAAA